MHNQTKQRCGLGAAVFGVLLLGADPLLAAQGALDRETGAAGSARTIDAAARTVRIADAASAFLASLNAEQKGAALFAFGDDEQRRRWSNLPEGLFDRRGVSWRDLTGEQRHRFTALLAALLSTRGLAMVERQMAAERILAAERGFPALVDWFTGVKRGDEYYYVSFLGAPTSTQPWMLQFGGHHLAINATMVGSRVTLSPTLTGGNPVRFQLNGEAVNIVAEEVSRATALFRSLSDQQRSKALISTKRIDLVSGPGNDGKPLPATGLPGREMTSTQKKLLLELIEARLGILNAYHLVPTLVEVTSDLDRTYFAWFGPSPDAGAAYWRVAGPRVLIEFAPQSRGGDPSNHLHNMYRDPANDYGMEWLKAN